MRREPRRGLLYSAITAAPQRQRSRPTPKPKPCPCGCGTPGMCARHRERLAAIREGMAGGDGPYKERWKQDRKRKAPVCCNPSCDSPRPRGERYCVVCRDDGWEEPE